MCVYTPYVVRDQCEFNLYRLCSIETCGECVFVYVFGVSV